VRNKTDPADAQVLAEYARRMPFQSWHPPQAALELRTIARHITALSAIKVKKRRQMGSLFGASVI